MKPNTRSSWNSINDVFCIDVKGCLIRYYRLFTYLIEFYLEIKLFFYVFEVLKWWVHLGGDHLSDGSGKKKSSHSWKKFKSTSHEIPTSNQAETSYKWSLICFTSICVFLDETYGWISRYFTAHGTQFWSEREKSFYKKENRQKILMKI